jgi:nucleotide-binding universal stress UspA family protein
MYKHILIAVDLEDGNTWQKPLDLACEYAKAFGSTLHIMTVVPNFGMSIVSTFFPANFEEEVLKKATETLHDFTKVHIPSEIQVQHSVGHGSIYEEILRVAEEITPDLIVMGTHRPNMQDYLIGPNTARVARHAACSVLIVRD